MQDGSALNLRHLDELGLEEPALSASRQGQVAEANLDFLLITGLKD